ILRFKRPWGTFSGLRQVGPSRIRDQWKEQREEEAPGATAKLALTRIGFKRPWGSFSGLRQVGPSRIRDQWKERREEEFSWCICKNGSNKVKAT
ncbi:hypothetical protein CEXT_470521, partial [Caerostris extrusa]